jgi:hypothetical protein
VRLHLLWPLRKLQSIAVLEIARVLQDGIDREMIPEHLVPGVAFSVALMKNTVDRVMRKS